MSRSPTHPLKSRSGPEPAVASGARQSSHLAQASLGHAGVPADPSEGADLPMPHERDQSSGQVEPGPAGSMRQAHQDLQAGQVDTDMRATPGLDAERRDAIAPPAKGADTRPRRGGTASPASPASPGKAG